MHLLSVVGERIKKHVFGSGASPKEWRILVIDKETARLLHHSLPMSEVLSQNIALIERFEEVRAGSTEFSAIYFVKMTHAVAKQIEKESKKKLYKGAYVISTVEIEERDKKLLDNVLAKMEKKSTKENPFPFFYRTVNFDCIPLASDLFQVPMDVSFYKDPSKYAEAVGARLRGVCTMINCITTPIPVGEKSEILANAVNTTGPGRLLIVERGMDVFSPLMHFFSFEALLWDIERAGAGYVLEPKSSKEAGEDKRVELDEDNTVWESVRNKQLVDAHEILFKMIKDASKSSDKEEKGNIKRLMRAVQELPSQTKTLKEIKLLMHLLEKSVDYFNTHKIRQVSEFEQGVVTGKDLEGNSFKSKATKEFFSILDQAVLTKEEKSRLYLLFMCKYQNISSTEEKKLLESGLITNKDIEMWKRVRDTFLGRELKPLTKRNIPIARYVPVIYDIVNGVVSKDKNICAHFKINIPSSGESLTGGSLRKREFVFKRVDTPSSMSPRSLIVYFIGGVSIAEITEIRELAKNAGMNIIIGSTDVYSPNGFLETI
ncbi:syntaxin-binding protein 1 [Nematocida sp. LUAm3]|nr:syntaxin-binding protein 1 [Nematocida sp. LUAm3]KAI5176316.1 syntaxin-binding protein 1 [Nematocida sp. LUAm2]KAI5178253.1 syntaxin-binding protein 1 [Nematocida sp. LUAm1]